MKYGGWVVMLDYRLNRIQKNIQIKAIRKKLFKLGFKCDYSNDHIAYLESAGCNKRDIKTILKKKADDTDEYIDLKRMVYIYQCEKEINHEKIVHCLDIFDEERLGYTLKKTNEMGIVEGRVDIDINTHHILYHSGDVDKFTLLNECIDNFRKINSYYKKHLNIETIVDLFSMY
jgi:hypothetical protein